MRRFLIKLLRGRPNEEVLEEAVAELFNIVTPDDILQEKGGVWYAGGKPLLEGEDKILVAEADVFTNSKLWKHLAKDIEYQACLRMFKKSQTPDDLLAGKLLLYLKDIIETRLKSLRKGSGRLNG